MKVPPGSTAGFTLTELLVVIGIIAFVLAASFSAKPKALTSRVAVAARSVSTALTMARARAMSSNVETVFRIDVEKGQFGLPNTMHALPRGMSVAVLVADTERYEKVGGIRFYPDGQSSGGEVALTLEGRSVRIAINWLTGEPRMVQ